jgi:hypothetical protein
MVSKRMRRQGHLAIWPPYSCMRACRAHLPHAGRPVPPHVAARAPSMTFWCAICTVVRGRTCCPCHSTCTYRVEPWHPGVGRLPRLVHKLLHHLRGLARLGAQPPRLEPRLGPKVHSEVDRHQHVQRGAHEHAVELDLGPTGGCAEALVITAAVAARRRCSGSSCGGGHGGGLPLERREGKHDAAHHWAEVAPAWLQAMHWEFNQKAGDRQSQMGSANMVE